MASKTRCACCSTFFLGRVTTCSDCSKPCCSYCKNNGSKYGVCCKCSDESCARTVEKSDSNVNNSNGNDVESGIADLSLGGFITPVTLFGTYYKGVGPNGPSLSEFERDDRWNWQPYQNFVKHVYKHMKSDRQLSIEEYMKLASWSTDYGIGSATWNGNKYDPNIKYDNTNFFVTTHPNYYEPEPIKAFEEKHDVPKPKTMDPPDSLVEIKSAASNDPSNHFCYNHLWAPGPLEDPTKYPFSFATAGSKGIHFFDQNHDFSKSYEPTDIIKAMVPDLESESWIYLHSSYKVTVGSLDEPDDIVLEFDLPPGFRTESVNVLKGSKALIHGNSVENKQAEVLIYDLNEGGLVTTIPICRYEHTYLHPVYSRYAIQNTTVVDPIRPNVCYLGLLSEKAFAIVDTRMKRAARWVEIDNPIKYMTIQSYGNCDKLSYSSGNDVVLYDLVAGKSRYRHDRLGPNKSDFEVYDIQSYGDQIALGTRSSTPQSPIISWLSWEKFESGSYFETLKDAQIGGSGNQFMKVNQRGVYVMEHKHAMFNQWQAPLNGTPLVSQIKAPSTSGVAPQQKGVRKAKREKVEDSFAQPVKAPIPPKPTKFTLESTHYQGIPSVYEMDSTYYSEGIWTANGSDDPDVYPFTLITYGGKGANVYDKDFKCLGSMCNDNDEWYCGLKSLTVENNIRMVAVGGANSNVGLYGFDNLFGKPTSMIENLSFKPEDLLVLSRSSSQLVIAGDDLLIYDIEANRRIHKFDMCSLFDLKGDRYRSDVFYSVAYDHGYIHDLRVDTGKPVRKLVTTDSNRIRGVTVCDYGSCDKIVFTQDRILSQLDLGTGKVIKEIEGEFGPVSSYSSLLCVSFYDSIKYYDLDNLSNVPLAESKTGSGCTKIKGVSSNKYGAYRKIDGYVFFFGYQ